jgi:hypothetical protein
VGCRAAACLNRLKASYTQSIFNPGFSGGNHLIRSLIKILETKLEYLNARKSCDIIDPSFQGIAGDICYIFEHLTSPKFL